MSYESRQEKAETSSAMRTYSNPGLSVEALRAKRIEEQKNEIFERIVGKSKDALDVIEDIMLNSEDDGHRLKAAQDLLNRGGMKQVQEIKVTHDNTTSPAEILMEKLSNLTRTEDVGVIDAEEVLDSEDNVE